MYRRECEPISPILISGIQYAIWGVMPPMGGGLRWCAKLTVTLWWGDRSLFVVKFPFIQNQVSKVFDGILIYAFHEDFDVIFGDV